MKNWYKNLEKPYRDFPAEAQILNMVSDLLKAKNLIDQQRSSAINHLFKAIILLDYIIEDKKWNKKLAELLRLREAIGSLIYFENPFGSFDQIIKAALLLAPGAYKKIGISSK